MPRLTLLVLVVIFAAEGCASHFRPSSNSDQREVVVHSFDKGLLGTRAANPAVKLRVDRDSMVSQNVLLVDYPAPNGNPASRDVHLDAENTDWSAGRALSFRVRPERAIRLSVSFLDRNHVAYTSWIAVRAGGWQTIRVMFATVRPNPYFQPANARTGAPLDVSEVHGVAFAPQDSTAGRLAMTRVVIVE